MEINRIDTYATPIWATEFPDLNDELPKMIAAVRAMRASADKAIKQKSNRNGWHSDASIFERKEFERLRAHVVAAVRHVFTDYGIDPGDRVFSLSGWANVHDRGGYNTSHVHPGSWISGSFYLLVPEGAGRIFFEDPRAAMKMEHVPLLGGKSQPRDPARARGRFNLSPRPGRLFMFPSWFEHGVESAECDERISIAFNVTPVQMRQAQQQVLAKMGTGNT